MKIPRKKWNPKAPFPPLNADETYIFFISVTEKEKDIDTFLTSMSHGEKERARKYRFKKDKNRYIVARGMLRRILGGFLCVSASNISFTYNHYGRPLLDPKIYNTSLKFNLSYSDDGIIIGITFNRKIGVDIETLDRDVKELVTISKNFFTENECNNICNTPIKEQNLLFLKYWVRKEAYIKAVGKGLSIPLHSFEILLNAEQPLKFLTSEHHDPQLDWNMIEFEPRKGFLSAIAFTGEEHSISIFEESTRLEQGSEYCLKYLKTCKP
ncbi:4'-phosphopantetheinyl transferase superfamily protein [bacterium]|nr:4'-phosphopantetheinyl transferase superfamily protein [bacterium]